MVDRKVSSTIHLMNNIIYIHDIKSIQSEEWNELMSHVSKYRLIHLIIQCPKKNNQIFYIEQNELNIEDSMLGENISVNI